jgi:hypothetical protein
VADALDDAERTRLGDTRTAAGMRTSAWGAQCDALVGAASNRWVGLWDCFGRQNETGS